MAFLEVKFFSDVLGMCTQMNVILPERPETKRPLLSLVSFVISCSVLLLLVMVCPFCANLSGFFYGPESFLASLEILPEKGRCGILCALSGAGKQERNT